MSNVEHEKSKSDEDHSHRPADGAGEDEGSAPQEGNDGHLKDDQKPITR